MSRRRFVAIAVALLSTLVASASGDAAAPASAGELPVGASFTAVTPFRLFDTRTDGTGPIAADASFDIQVGGVGEIPADAIAVALNLTYVDATGPGYVTVWPAGTSRPNASNLNKVGAGPVPNATVTKTGTSGRISLYNQGSATQLFADVAGYYTLAGSTSGTAGPTGAKGPTGPKGSTGAKGPVGADGVAGATGPRGFTPPDERYPYSSAVVREGVGTGAVITIGANGQPNIVYDDGQFLRLLRCADPACHGTTVRSLAFSPPGDVVAMTITNDGRPVVAYGTDGGAVKVAACADASCQSVSTGTVYSGDTDLAATSLSMVIGPDGNPFIAYSVSWNGATALIAIRCDDADCSTSSSQGLAMTKPGTKIDTVIGLDGNPLIAVFSNTWPELTLIRCGTVACNPMYVGMRTDVGGLVPSVAIGTNGFPLIAYTADDSGDRSVKLIRCSSLVCESADDAILLAQLGSDEADSVSVAVGADGLPVTMWRVIGDGSIHLARCTDTACTAFVSTTAATSTTNAGYGASMAIGNDGFPVIVHGDAVSGAGMAVTHCGNVFCTPYARNR